MKIFPLFLLSFFCSLPAFAQQGFSAGINAGVNLSLTKLEYGYYTVPAQFRNRQMVGINQALYLEYGFNERLALRFSLKRANLTNAGGFYNIVTRTNAEGKANAWSTAKFSSTHSPVHIDLTLRTRHPMSQKIFLTMA